MNKGVKVRNRRSLFWRLWYRSLVVRRPQAALAMVSLLVGAAVASMLLNLYGDVHRKMTQEFRAYGANVILGSRTAASAGPASLAGLIDAAAFEHLTALQSTLKGFVAAPVLYVVARISRLPSDPRLPSFENVVAVGTDFAAMRTLAPGWRIAAGPAQGTLDSNSCAVGAHLAERLRLKPGDTLALEVAQQGAITAKQESFRVERVVATGASEDDQVFVPLADLQRLAGVEGKISLIEMNIPGETAGIESAVHGIAAVFPSLEVRPVRQIVYSQGKVLETIRWLLISLMVLILLIIALCVMATMTSIVLERRKDIAVMKALGASNHEVTQLFLTEGATLGLIGGLAGFAVGGILASAVAERLFGVSIEVVWWTLPVVCMATAVLAVLATFFPVGMMRRIQPATALKGE
ncbi:MAG TPA: FtsX-like permease family protein [Terriglobia bacterium]|nr:FtsX-like permease family protein [Terriglobia bacterium]